MSKQNKANKNNYVQAGRLTPDDMARERQKMNPERVRNQADDSPKAPRGGRGSTPPQKSREEQG